MKRKYTFFIIIFLILVSCATFGRIAGNDFINLDDPACITANDNVQSGLNLQTIKWSFTAVVLGHWLPLTMISHILDWSLFGANASGHHIVSLLLHIGAVIFLFLFLYKATNHLWPSAFVAALFALHPLRVESVAWAAERKDVLSMFFGMACLYAYAFYCEQKKISRYLLCLLLFALSLMSKATLVTLPFALMLLDFWPLNRWGKQTDEKGKTFHSMKELIGEKIPLICLSFASSIITLWAQNKGGALNTFKSLPLFERVNNAMISYVAYLGKIFWPVDLAVFYPYDFSLPVWKVFISGMIIIVITMIVLYYKKKLPFLFVGWFWYLGTLIPVIGLMQAGGQSMADRYTYLPSVGIAIMLAWGIPTFIKSEKIQNKIILQAAIALLAILSLLSWEQCGYWKNNFTLYAHTLKVTKDNALAHNNLGVALSDKGKIEEAMYHHNEAIRISPESFDAHLSRGNAYVKLGQYELAMKDYNKALSLKPNPVEIYIRRGNLYGQLGQHHQAINDFNEAIRMKPDHADAFTNRGICYAELGHHERALPDLNEALRLKPNNADFFKNRAIFHFKQGNKILGCNDARKACIAGNCMTLEIAYNKGYCR